MCKYLWTIPGISQRRWHCNRVRASQELLILHQMPSSYGLKSNIDKHSPDSLIGRKIMWRSNLVARKGWKRERTWELCLGLSGGDGHNDSVLHNPQMDWGDAQRVSTEAGFANLPSDEVMPFAHCSLSAPSSCPSDAKPCCWAHTVVCGSEQWCQCLRLSVQSPAAQAHVSAAV